jgi:Asp-tRNA(Asn)/Glu-tRNA(Gln) amidotransferase A subunit family amidase
VLETGGWTATSDGARKAFDAAKEKLAKAGIELKGRRDDADIEAAERAMADAQPLSLAINAWEGRWPLNTYADLDKTKLSEGSLGRLKQSETMTQKDVAGLLAQRVAARQAFATAASRDDAFVTLGACGAAPVGLGSTGNTAMNVAASLLGCPAITIPLLEDEGMPLGLQLLGGVDHDADLMAIAAWVAGDAFGRNDLVGTVG